MVVEVPPTDILTMMMAAYSKVRYLERFHLLDVLTPEKKRYFAGRTIMKEICHNPVSLPLSWRVELKANVAGAAPAAAR